MTSYEVIYDRFLQKVTDFDLSAMQDEQIQSMLSGWLVSSISKFRRCNQDLTDRDDDMESFNIDLRDEEIEILATLMVGEWIEPQLNSVLLTHQFYGGKEEKFYAQANQLSALKVLRDDTRTEARKLMRDYSYRETNPYFSN